MAISDYAHPKIIESTFSFPKFVPTSEKSISSIFSFSRYSQFYSPITKLATPMLKPKIFNYLLICVNFYQHAKNQLIHSWDTVNLKVKRPDWLHPFLTMPNHKIFDQLLIFVNYAVSRIYVEEMVDIKSWNLTGWYHFGILQEQSKYSAYLRQNFLYSEEQIKIHLNYLICLI